MAPAFRNYSPFDAFGPIVQRSKAELDKGEGLDGGKSLGPGTGQVSEVTDRKGDDEHPEGSQWFDEYEPTSLGRWVGENVGWECEDSLQFASPPQSVRPFPECTEKLSRHRRQRQSRHLRHTFTLDDDDESARDMAIETENGLSIAISSVREGKRDIDVVLDAADGTFKWCAFFEGRDGGETEVRGLKEEKASMSCRCIVIKLLDHFHELESMLMFM